MSYSRETQEKISRFAKEQSRQYLDYAEMTYLEKLRGKAGETKQKIERKLSRFRPGSEQAHEAESDLTLYMCDYMDDLISKGMSEREAFEKARDELSAPENAGMNARYQQYYERYQQFYENRDPADYESVGMVYGGFSVLGLVIGALIGYITGGGRAGFLSGGWIDTLIGLAVGLLIGVGLAQIGHAVIVGRKRR